MYVCVCMYLCLSQKKKMRTHSKLFSRNKREKQSKIRLGNKLVFPFLTNKYQASKQKKIYIYIYIYISKINNNKNRGVRRRRQSNKQNLKKKGTKKIQDYKKSAVRRTHWRP